MKQSKGTLTSMKVILTILFFSQTVAAFDVSIDVIGQVDNKLTLVCGQNVTFVCSVKPVTDSMDWFIDTLTVATCKAGFCAAQSILPANANFEYSTSAGIYNLTFSPVLASDDAREYKCQFGSDKKSIIPTVTVFPDESFSVITNASNANDINITVSTCVSSSDFVSFKWYIFKAGESRKLFDTSMNLLKNVSSCQSTSNCNGEMSTSTITIKNLKEENGDFFFFQIEILYTYSSDAQPYIVTVDSPTQYKISENSVATDDNGCEIDIKETLFFVLMSVTRIYAIQIVLSHTIYKRVKEYIGTGKSCTTCIIVLFSSLPILGFIPLLIWFKCVSFCEKVTIKWSWKKTITTIVATVALIVVGEPSVIYILIYVKYLTQPVTVFVLFGLSIIMVALEILICGFICQDYNGDMLFAAVIVYTIILLFLVSACIRFLVGCQRCYDNSNKYCCGQNQVSACNLQNNVAEGSHKNKVVKSIHQNEVAKGSEQNRVAEGSHQNKNAEGKNEIHCGKCKANGNSTASHTYCLSHGLYICTGCLDDCKINCVLLLDTYEKSNLFYCSYCTVGKKVPVVCFDLLSREFKCANCFKVKTLAPITPTTLLFKEVSDKIDKITNDAPHFQCHKGRSKVESIHCKAEVYCLVCKLIMCRTCFISHTESCIRDKKL